MCELLILVSLFATLILIATLRQKAETDEIYGEDDDEN
jgi:hypothetical protein